MAVHRVMKKKKRGGTSHKGSHTAETNISPLGSSDIGGASQMPVLFVRAQNKSKLLKG